MRFKRLYTSFLVICASAALHRCGVHAQPPPNMGAIEHLFGEEVPANLAHVDTSLFENWLLHAPEHAPPPAVDYQAVHGHVPNLDYAHQSSGYPRADHGANVDPNAYHYYAGQGQEQDFGHFPQADYGQPADPGYAHHQTAEEPLSVYDYLAESAMSPSQESQGSSAHGPAFPIERDHPFNRAASGSASGAINAQVDTVAKGRTGRPRTVPRRLRVSESLAKVIDDPTFHADRVSAQLRKTKYVPVLKRVKVATAELQAAFLRHYKDELRSALPAPYQDLLEYIHFAPFVSRQVDPKYMGSVYESARRLYVEVATAKYPSMNLDNLHGPVDRPLHLGDYFVNVVIDPQRQEEHFFHAPVVAQHRAFPAKDKEGDVYRRFYLGELYVPKEVVMFFAPAQ
ncbi:uncharacterized protein PSFLO_03566 [Pseudozyma flocculosa]|uniref:Uncharacterized protein n=1 Tax=Pseudozyma flocculosa TaxID=84751 RepID=A0A5C3F3Q5_9BASI|nr:uncharacterized protein PSFLO_03566 [Pseudozyma flocculosa]